MRPATTVWFERLIAGTLVLGMLQTWLGWNQLRQRVEVPINFIIFVDAFIFGLIVLLTLLVSRRRSKVAMWISIVMFVLGLPAVIKMFAHGPLIGSAGISLLQTIGQIAAFVLLFTPSARDWMNKEDPLSDLKRTFS